MPPAKILASLVLAMLSFLLWSCTDVPAFPIALFSAVLAILGLWDVERRQGRTRDFLIGTLTLLSILVGAAWFSTLVPFANKMVDGDMTHNSLKQLAFAMHAYCDVHGTLPAQAIFDKRGKPLLSWRVSVLPFIEQEALFREFRLNEPWDSPHNLALLPKMPSTFASWRKSSSQNWGMAFYQVLVGDGAAFEGKRGLRLKADFPDGLANTILIVQTEEPVPWTKPDDLRYAADLSLPTRTRFYAALADGSVHFFDHADEATIRAAITRNGKENNRVR